MYKFKKTTNTTGTFKDVAIQNGMFIDEETGEVIQLAKVLENVYGSGAVINITTKEKTDQDIEPEIPQEDGGSAD